MERFTREDIKKATSEGKFTLGGYVVFRCLLYTASFFDNKKEKITLSRVKNVRGSGYKDISYEDFFSECQKLTTKQARKRYPTLVM